MYTSRMYIYSSRKKKKTKTLDRENPPPTQNAKSRTGQRRRHLERPTLRQQRSKCKPEKRKSMTQPRTEKSKARIHHLPVSSVIVSCDSSVDVLPRDSGAVDRFPCFYSRHERVWKRQAWGGVGLGPLASKRRRLAAWWSDGVWVADKQTRKMQEA
ncbi:uncharacterized protein BKA78DRAFT_30491 [Phyllosticta capitalensis]|uniref:uncharacterized protein n=1 Tax=Phyllosticta capitalensis TaxID=121624 RepID=UPI00312DD0DD